MNIKTVYFNFDDGTVTWFHPSEINWDAVRDNGRLHQIYLDLSPIVKQGPVWLIQIRHKAIRSARWVLCAGTDPDYSQTVYFIRKELSVAII